VPPTILAQDVLAGMRKGENTIARKGLMIIDKKGKVAFFHTGVADGATVRKILKQAGV
jgi:hypothetical protein